MDSNRHENDHHRLRTPWSLVAGMLLALCSTLAHADVASGLQWLQSRDSATGVHRPGDLANAPDTNAEAFITVTALSSTPNFPGTAAQVLDERDETLLSVARLARNRLVLGQSAAEQFDLLLAAQASDGGFPALPGLQSEPLTTAWVLSALDRAGRGGQTEASRALGYLITAQQSDGGWLAALGNFSNVVATSQVARVLNDYRNRYTLTQPIARALIFLQAARLPSNTFGEPFETPTRSMH